MMVTWAQACFRKTPKERKASQGPQKVLGDSTQSLDVDCLNISL